MAYCLNRAVWYFGSSVEEDMQAAADNLGEKANDQRRAAARQRVLDKYLEKDSKPRKGQFADPVAKIRG